MYRRELSILLLVPLVGIGCASQPELAPEPPAATLAGTEPTGQSQEKPIEKPEKDLRYRLPPAQRRSLTVYIGSQSFDYEEDDRVVVSGQVSTGTAEHPTPTGDFRVMSKDIDKRSGKYTNYFDENTPMPYSLQFKGPYFVHEGWVPVQGYADSHGCVRLRYEDAKLIFHRIKVGDRILVKGPGAARPADPWPDLFPVF